MHPFDSSTAPLKYLALTATGLGTAGVKAGEHHILHALAVGLKGLFKHSWFYDSTHLFWVADDLHKRLWKGKWNEAFQLVLASMWESYWWFLIADEAGQVTLHSCFCALKPVHGLVLLYSHWLGRGREDGYWSLLPDCADIQTASSVFCFKTKNKTKPQVHHTFLHVYCYFDICCRNLQLDINSLILEVSLGRYYE